jgi:uncharacterized protein (DUF2336 family)
MEAGVVDLKLLLQFAQSASETGQQRLAEAVSRFFDTKNLSAADLDHASDIVLNLIRQADLDLREALAEKLAAQESIPSEVITFLAYDVISVARPVLLRSPVLNDIDLTLIIAAKGKDYWRSIAERSELSTMVADRLIDTGDAGTVLQLIDNQSIILPKNSVKKIIRMSFKSEDLQAPLLRRPEIDADLAVDLYMCVSQVLRNKIIERFHIPPARIEASLDDLVKELSLEAKGLHWVTPDMMTLARHFNERDEISPDMMVKTLRRKQLSFFVALFAEKSGLDPEDVVRMLKKEGGKHFALACRSIGTMKSEFAAMFLLSRGIKTEEQIVDQREMAAALEYYDTVKDFDIPRIMKAWAKKPADDFKAAADGHVFFPRRPPQRDKEPSYYSAKENQTLRPG